MPSLRKPIRFDTILKRFFSLLEVAGRAVLLQAEPSALLFGDTKLGLMEGSEEAVGGRWYCAVLVVFSLLLHVSLLK